MTKLQSEVLQPAVTLSLFTVTDKERSMTTVVEDTGYGPKPHLHKESAGWTIKTIQNASVTSTIPTTGRFLQTNNLDVAAFCFKTVIHYKDIYGTFFGSSLTWLLSFPIEYFFTS